MSIINDQFLEIFLKSVSEGILVVNRENEIVFVNEAVSTQFGYSNEELLGNSLGILLPERIKAHHKTYTETYFKHPTVRRMSDRDDIYGRHKDGHLISVD
ncbi:MAG: PAS domain S-box protein, partial [Bacteroidetes bacterium]|nr:PAS domain S-box protein [Bacteroidota bacterium]